MCHPRAMDMSIRLIVLLYVALSGINYANTILSGRGDKEIDLIVLVIGLIAALILIATDIVQKNQKKKVHIDIKPIDYYAIILWLTTILLSFHKLYIGRHIRELLDLRGNPIVYQIIELLIVLLFLAAFGALAIALLRFGRLKSRSCPWRFVIPFLGRATLILAFTVPLGTVRFGSCGGLQATRLSPLGGNKQQFEDFKQEAHEKALKRDQSRKAM